MEAAIVLPIGHLSWPQRLWCALGNIGVVVLLVISRQGQITWQQVRKQAEVSQTLNVGVAAQGVNATARHADVAQQQLQHGTGANHLRTDRVLSPA